MQDIILPFKCQYADCTIFCNNINKDLVDFMNKKIGQQWSDIMDYLSDKFVNSNDEFIELNIDEKIIKYILYCSTCDINYSNNTNVDIGCYATIVLEDGYFIMLGDGSKSNVFVLVFDDYQISCHFETNCVL